MVEQSNLQELKNSLSIKEEKIGLKHTINRKAKLFPFVTRGTERPKFRRGFEGVLGEFTRNICENTFEGSLEIDDLIDEISNMVNVNKEDQAYLVQILNMVLQHKNGKIKVFHPHLFQYLSLSDGPEMKGEQEIGKFLADVLIEDSTEFQKIFEKQLSHDLISKLILDKLNGLSQIDVQKKYGSKLPYLSRYFQDDFLFLSRYEDYFKTHYELLLSYYYFIYISQLSIKLAQQSKANFTNNNEVYFTLDWEATSKSRKGYGYGYQLVKDAARNLLIHVNTLEHLNTLMGLEDSTVYPELLDKHEALSEEESQSFLELLKQWIIEYRVHSSLPEIEICSEGTYSSLVDLLYSSIEEAYQKPSMQGPRNRYSLSIEEIGKKFFLKTRGSLGYMLNVSQDLFLLLTAVCLKNERKSLNQLFIDLENRGMYFDRYSKEEAVKLLDKLNLLDKKSDSGDAQYVKPIL
ncbi:DNA phosphorothioation-dependent restriction protein DptG [Priestia aryabhattai]|uniref:DNA phosphorothioation-dependent restriction protein DptG n=1 Tax=Bacillaceae TaxID=186817 RepID=UPI000B9FAB2F|nr:MULTISPECIES: DNA phosphorothioation-dependent restriction protein DptG [Bacillaceae]OZT13656.1 DNA phosphorothioation-dependent restriction protein DptG [Priestia aryabhattai]QCS52973.1 DNA phosphorothioation-dependent restriction protein DptG [Priestia flexa]TDB49700.1 DNA phosphorothioation-dependent restriction protein DptG [Bacillus sp. CBEL-1]USY53361.1 DNA phosphorothioation-dependent restriction protein DptG [Bacillus sp. 1780r2a1]